jgi:hypothetical protein
MKFGVESTLHFVSKFFSFFIYVRARSLLPTFTIHEMDHACMNFLDTNTYCLLHEMVHEIV